MAKKSVTTLNLPSKASTVTLDASSVGSVLAASDQTAFFPWGSGAGSLPSDGVTVTAASFTGPQNVSVTTTENYGSARSKVLQFVVTEDASKVATLAISQSGNSISLAPSELVFPVAGSTMAVEVTSNISDDSLITCTIPEAARSYLSVSKNGRTFNFTALPNTGTLDSRSTQVTFRSGPSDGPNLVATLTVTQAGDTSPVYGQWELNGGIVESDTDLPASGGTLTWRIGMPYRSVTWGSKVVTTQYAYQDTTASVNGSVALNDASSVSAVFTFSYGDLGPGGTLLLPVGASVWDSPDGSNAGGYRLVTITCASAGAVVSDQVNGSFAAVLQGSGITTSAPLNGSATRAENVITSRVFGQVDWVVNEWGAGIPASNSSVFCSFTINYVDTYSSASTKNGTSAAGDVSIKGMVGDSPLDGVTLTDVQGSAGELSGELFVPYNPNDSTREVTLTLLAKDKDGSTYVEMSNYSQTFTQAEGYIGSFSDSTDTYDLPNADSSQTFLYTSFPASALSATLDEGVDYYSVSFTDGSGGVDVHFTGIKPNNTGAVRNSTLVIKGE